MARKLRISPGRWVFIVLLVVGLSALTYMGSRARLASGKAEAEAAPAAPAPQTTGQQIYDADIPRETMPESLLGGLILLSAEQLARVPYTDGFQWPCGTPEGAMMYDAQPFGSPNELRGGHHTGADLNGIGGNNSDLGVPVRAAARGLVIYSGVPSEHWGNVIVLAHRLPGTNRIIQTLYAHLDERDRNAIVGQTVARGDTLGTIGTANGHYLAHLHFEAIESRCTEAGMPGYAKQGTMNRLDPMALLREHPAPAFPDAYADIRRIRIREAAQTTTASPASAPAATINSEGTLIVNPAQHLH